jgi:hypothetical protein
MHLFGTLYGPLLVRDNLDLFHVALSAVRGAAPHTCRLWALGHRDLW